jgi:hypothetical protein
MLYCVIISTVSVPTPTAFVQETKSKLGKIKLLTLILYILHEVKQISNEPLHLCKDNLHEFNISVLFHAVALGLDKAVLCFCPGSTVPHPRSNHNSSAVLEHTAVFGCVCLPFLLGDRFLEQRKCQGCLSHQKLLQVPVRHRGSLSAHVRHARYYTASMGR